MAAKKKPQVAKAAKASKTTNATATAVTASNDLHLQMRAKNNRLISRLHQLKLEMDSIMEDLCEPPPGCDPPPKG